MAHAERCPTCEDEAVAQREIDGETLWVAVGWDDPSHPGENIAIDFCPFCGSQLDELEEADDEDEETAP